MDKPVNITYTAELLRKLIHLLTAMAPLCMLVVGKWPVAFVFALLAAIALGYDVLRARSAWFARWVHRCVGFMLRTSEWSRGRVVASGATWVLVSLAVVAILFPVRIAVPALVMSLASDAVAAIVGRRIGRHRWPGSLRTVEGTAAFVASGLAIMALFPGIAFWAGAGCVLAAALAEIPSRPLDDNFRVPASAAVTLYCLDLLVWEKKIKAHLPYPVKSP